jgi:hypothetical protein
VKIIIIQSETGVDEVIASGNADVLICSRGVTGVGLDASYYMKDPRDGQKLVTYPLDEVSKDSKAVSQYFRAYQTMEDNA